MRRKVWICELLFGMRAVQLGPQRFWGWFKQYKCMYRDPVNKKCYIDWFNKSEIIPRT